MPVMKTHPNGKSRIEAIPACLEGDAELIESNAGINEPNPRLNKVTE